MSKPKILIFRGGALGDVLMATPVIKQVYENYNGQCEIYVQTGCPDVFKNNPYVYAVNPPDQRFDVIYNLAVGYENNPKQHAVIAYGETIFGKSVEIADKSLSLYPTNEDKSKIKALGYENYIVMHMRQHNWPSRNLKIDFYKSVVEQILNRTNVNIIQVGGEHEVAFAGNPRLKVDLAKYTIHELKCLIDDASAFIGIDGGLIHVAACTNTPMLSFFTSCRAKYRMPLRTDIKFYPLEANIDCYGCQEDLTNNTEFVCHKGNVPCIDSFDATSVVNTLISALSIGR